MNNSFGYNLRRIRSERGMSQDDFAAFLGTSKQVISRYETEQRTPKITVVEEYATKLSVPLGELTGYKNNLSDKGFPSLTAHEQNHITHYRKCDDSGKEMVDRVLDYEYHRSTGKIPSSPPPETKIIQLPLYNEPAAAGMGNYLLDNDNDYELTDFPALSVPHNSSYAVKIAGDSMEPDIPDESIIFVECCPCVNPGDVGIFLLDGESFCKKFVYDKKNCNIQLVSLNPDYDPIIINSENDLRVMGKVLGVYEED